MSNLVVEILLRLAKAGAALLGEPVAFRLAPSDDGVATTGLPVRSNRRHV